MVVNHPPSKTRSFCVSILIQLSVPHRFLPDRPTHKPVDMPAFGPPVVGDQVFYALPLVQYKTGVAYHAHYECINCTDGDRYTLQKKPIDRNVPCNAAILSVGNNQS